VCARWKQVFLWAVDCTLVIIPVERLANRLLAHDFVARERLRDFGFPGHPRINGIEYIQQCLSAMIDRHGLG